MELLSTEVNLKNYLGKNNNNVFMQFYITFVMFYHDMIWVTESICLESLCTYEFKWWITTN